MKFTFQQFTQQFTFYSDEMYSEPCLTFKMECFEKQVNSFHLLNTFAKSSILVIWQESEYAFAR